MKYGIEELTFFFHEVSAFNNDNHKLHQWLSNVAKEENVSLAELNVIFCSDDYLLEINKEFLNHDFYTDVITFHDSDDETQASEIYISIERVRDNANAMSIDFDKEKNRVVLHGLLHIIGYKDADEDQQQLMRTKEDYYLSLLP